MPNQQEIGYLVGFSWHFHRT